MILQLPVDLLNFKVNKKNCIYLFCIEMRIERKKLREKKSITQKVERK